MENEMNKKIKHSHFECDYCDEDVGDGETLHNCGSTPTFNNESMKLLAEQIRKIEYRPLVGEPCLNCHTLTLEKSYGLLYGPWSGRIRCTTCNYNDSFMSYVGRKSITIEPL